MRSIILLVVLAGCSSKDPEKKPVIYSAENPEVSTTKPKGTSIVAKQLATEEGSNLVAEVRFKENESALSSEATQKIKRVYDRAKKKGEIVEAQLIAWGDQDLPPEGKKELNDKQQELSLKRGKSLEKLISSWDDEIEIKHISMAERASTLAKFMSTEEAQVKESLESKETGGRASEAMVIFMLEK